MLCVFARFPPSQRQCRSSDPHQHPPAGRSLPVAVFSTVPIAICVCSRSRSRRRTPLSRFSRIADYSTALRLCRMGYHRVTPSAVNSVLTGRTRSVWPPLCCALASEPTRDSPARVSPAFRVRHSPVHGSRILALRSPPRPWSSGVANDAYTSVGAASRFCHAYAMVGLQLYPLFSSFHLLSLSPSSFRSCQSPRPRRNRDRHPADRRPRVISSTRGRVRPTHGDAFARVCARGNT